MDPLDFAGLGERGGVVVNVVLADIAARVMCLIGAVCLVAVGKFVPPVGSGSDSCFLLLLLQQS